MEMSTEIGILLAYALGIFALYVVGYMFLVPIKVLLRLVINSVAGAISILAINWIDQLVVWVYSLKTDVPGDFIKKPMKECTGKEITQEWLYHMGVPEAEILDMAEKSAHCIPCMMPFVTAFFMPRANGDRPKVVPEGSKNFAFIGQFSDTVRDTVFTTEYSVRTGMEAVYTLLDVDRGVPEVFGSCYDIRVLLD